MTTDPVNTVALVVRVLRERGPRDLFRLVRNFRAVRAHTASHSRTRCACLNCFYRHYMWPIAAGTISFCDALPAFRAARNWPPPPPCATCGSLPPMADHGTCAPMPPGWMNWDPVVYGARAQSHATAQAQIAQNAGNTGSAQLADRSAQSTGPGSVLNGGK